jgi:hypothetical protein
MSVTLYPVSLTLEEFQTVQEDERIFYLKIGMVTNEVNMLSKMALFSLSNTKEGDVYNRAASALALLQLRMLAGRLYEAREVITTGYKPLKVRYESKMKGDGNRAYSKINGYFHNPDNLVKAMRHKLAFHTDHDAFAEGVSLIQEDDELTDYMCVERGNSLFWSGELAVIATLKHLTGLEGEAIYRKLMDDMFSLSRAVTDFTFNFSRSFYDRHFPEKRKRAAEAHITLDCLPSEEMSIGFFYDVPKRLAGA